MKKIALWLIAALLIGSGIAVMALRDVRFDWRDLFQGADTVMLEDGIRHSVDETRTIDLASQTLDELTVKSVSESVEITYEARDEVEITLKGDYTASESIEIPTLLISTEHNRLTVEIERGKVNPITIMSSNLRLMVRIPKSLQGDLTVENISGGVKIRAPGSDELGGELHVKTVSGRIYAEGVEAEAVQLETTSGVIEFRGSTVRLGAETVSGRVSVYLTNLTGSSRLNSVSGDVALNVEKALNHKVKLQTTSGLIEIDRADLNYQTQEKHRVEATAGTGEHTLNISTVSGKILLSGS